MPRTASPRSVRLAVIVGAGALAATAVYTATQHANASEAPAPPVEVAATVGSQMTAPPRQTPPTPRPSTEAGKPVVAPTSTPSRAPERAQKTTLEASRVTTAQLPDGRAQKWKELAPPSTRQLSQDFQLNECVTVHGAATWQQQGFISAHKTPAVQDSLAFEDEAKARSAFRKVVADMNTCEATSRALQKQYGLAADATVEQTAVADNGAAWSRSWTAVQGLSAPGAQANHVYAVQRGSVLILLHFDEWDSAAPRTYDSEGDADVLAGLSR